MDHFTASCLGREGECEGGKKVSLYQDTKGKGKPVALVKIRWSTF